LPLQGALIGLETAHRRVENICRVGNLLLWKSRFSAYLRLRIPKKVDKWRILGTFGNGCPVAIGIVHSINSIGIGKPAIDWFQEWLVAPNFSYLPSSRGRRFYVSLVRTIHGGAGCYCGYPASRSLCCVPLKGICSVVSSSTVHLVQWSSQVVEGKACSGRSGLAWPLLFKYAACRQEPRHLSLCDLVAAAESGEGRVGLGASFWPVRWGFASPMR
jgi:hypothetical protein